MTGESWSEAIARPLVFGLMDNAVVVGLFYVSFIILTQLVLTNVVVAVLLDNFVTDGLGDKENEVKGAPEISAAAGASFLVSVPSRDSRMAEGSPTVPSPDSRMSEGSPGGKEMPLSLSREQDSPPLPLFSPADGVGHSSGITPTLQTNQVYPPPASPLPPPIPAPESKVLHDPSIQPRMQALEESVRGLETKLDSYMRVMQASLEQLHARFDAVPPPPSLAVVPGPGSVMNP